MPLARIARVVVVVVVKIFTAPENISSYFLFLLYILESKDALTVTR